MNLYTEKMKLVCNLKDFLDSKDFQEVLTPVLRRDNSNKVIQRVCTDLGFALRDSHELQLRYLLSRYHSVYEIGSCFRREDVAKSATNAAEFLLMELFTSKYDLVDLEALTREFILRYRPDTKFEAISVAECIRKDLNVDLFNTDEYELFCVLRKRYPDESFEQDYKYVLHYIETEIEPLGKGKVIFFRDYPQCTCSYANIISGSVVSRFELFADGLELANAFDDECSPERFIERNRQYPIFPAEENATVRGLKDGTLPSKSAGLGIGIERLCMFIYGNTDFNDFAFPSEDF